MGYQMSVFDIINNRQEFKIDKPIRLIELFAGYGSQHFALEYLGANFESWKICEWAIKSIQAYKDAHFSEDNTDYSKDLSKDEIDQFLFKKGISSNYNEPMSFEQIKRLGEDKKRAIYNNIIATHNLVSVVNCKASDLEIVDRDKYTYILTYSFPCQDLSKAGKGKGMEKGSGTRSGMLWEVERILDECNGNLPQVLVMENVPDVIGEKNKLDFAKWYQKLESLGYANFYEILNAKDYGIPQNRERCFMVSILGDYYYNFPSKVKLEKRLKDLLEDHVDENYYLSNKIKNFFYENSKKNEKKGNGFRFTPKTKDSINYAKCITTRNGSRMDDNFIIDTNNKALNETIKTNSIKDGDYIDAYNKSVKSDIAGTITTRVDASNMTFIAEKNIKIKEATKKGYAEAYEGDSINLEQPNSKTRRGRVGKQQANTLTTSCNQCVVVRAGQFQPKDRDYNKKGIKREEQFETRSDELSNAILTGDRKNCVAEADASDFISKDLPYNYQLSIKQNLSQLRIRKFTPKECFRLMGVKDEDFERIAKNQSNASLYHLAGDSIVTNVLMAIFGEMINKRKE